MIRTDNLSAPWRAGLLAVAVAACALAALGAGRGESKDERRIDRSGPAPADGRVSIELLAGSVRVEGWDRQEVQVTGTLDEQAEGLHFDPGKRTRIEVDYPRKIRNVDGCELLVRVPAGSRVEIECVSAGVEVVGVRGAVEVSSTEGDVTVAGPCRSLDVEVVDGDVTATALEGPVEIDCTSGEIRLAGGTGNVDIESVQGDIEVEFERLDDLAIESVSGNARVTADLNPSGRYEITAFAGRITLAVPATVSASIEAATFSGRIRSDFAAKDPKRDAYVPGQKREITIGGGSAEVELTAFSGDIEILER